jgi:hypothetical protein
MERQDVSENIRAVATEDGDVLLTIVDSKKRVRITLPIEAAQKLEAQIKAALVTDCTKRISGLL